jgi:GNAT superfamily N-acetyltransferase
MQIMGQVYKDSIGTPLTERFVRDQLNTSQETVIVERVNKPIGYYNYSLYSPERAYFGALILLPDAQAKGIGKQVLKHFENQMQSRGIRTIEGHVQTANSRAIVFWLKNGFRIVDMPMRGLLAVEKELSPLPKL